MSNKTTVLQLEKPNRGEYINSWQIPVNSNSDKVDDYVKTVNEELGGVSSASGLTGLKGTHASLKARLDAAMDDEGNINESAVPVIGPLGQYMYTPIDNQNFYGNGLSGAQGRIEAQDKQAFENSGPLMPSRYADGSGDSVVSIHSENRNAVTKSYGIINAGTTVLDSASPLKLKVVATPEDPVELLIKGHYFRFKETIEYEVGNDGQWYAYAAMPTAIEDQYLEGLDNLTADVTGVDGDSWIEIQGAMNLVIIGVRQYDILIIPSGNLVGKYIIKTPPTLLEPRKFEIYGQFTEIAADIAGVKIADRYKPILLATETVPDEFTGQLDKDTYCPIGEIEFATTTYVAGSIITYNSTGERAYSGVYDSGWAKGDIYLAQEKIHSLGRLPAQATVYVAKDITGIREERFYLLPLRDNSLLDFTPGTGGSTLTQKLYGASVRFQYDSPLDSAMYTRGEKNVYQLKQSTIAGLGDPIHDITHIFRKPDTNEDLEPTEVWLRVVIS